MEIVGLKNILPNEISNRIFQFLSHPTADIIKPYIVEYRKFIGDMSLRRRRFYSFATCMVHIQINNHIVCRECYSEIVKFYWRDDCWEYDYVCDNCSC